MVIGTIITLGTNRFPRCYMTDPYSLGHLSCLTYGLEKWVDLAPRHNIIYANKEGLVSLPGYIAIYLLAMSSQPISSVLKLSMFSLISWVMYYSLNWFGFVTSRKLANTTYVLWVVGTCLSNLTACMFIEKWSKNSDPPEILAAINDNQLVVFLLVSTLIVSFMPLADLFRPIWSLVALIFPCKR
jgi:phosphatidylinositol glycan class W